MNDMFDEIYRYRDLTSSKSKIHKNYEDITYGEVISRFNDIKFDYNDYETCIDMANVITHLNNNGSIDDAKTGVEDDKIDAIGSFIKSCNSDIFKVGSPLQIASTILKLAADPKKDNLSKEQFEKMVQDSVTKEELEKQKGKQENEQEDREKQDNDENPQQNKEKSDVSDDKSQSENEDQEKGDNGQDDNGEENSNENSEGSGENEKDSSGKEKQSDSKENSSESDGNGRGKKDNIKNGDNSDDEKEESDENNGENSQQKPGSYSGQNPLLKRLNDNPKDVIEEIQKYTEVREISNTYGLPMNDILNYKTLLNSYKDFLNKIAILESRGKLKAKKFIPKENTDLMNEYSQVSKLRNKTQMLMPNFGYKLATKNLIVKRPSFPTKQALCLLIDDSGSMRERYKMDWVQAILWNRAVESEKKNIDLYAALFEGSVYEITKINNLDEAKRFYTKIGFNGGGTNVQGAAEYMMKYFKDNHIEAQVVVINDGQDPVNISWEPTQELHAIMLGYGNINLQEVVKKKDGHYEIFTQ